MIMFNITTEERGDDINVHTVGDVNGSEDVVALEIYAMLSELEEKCPRPLMAAIRKMVSERD